MILGLTIVILAIISILMALRSLKQLKKLEKVNEVKDDLRKGKVIFQSDASSPSVSESSSSLS